MKNITSIIILLSIIVFSNCSEKDSKNPVQIFFTGVSDHGIFDPSISKDPASDRIWMTYSAVDDYPNNALNSAINTRLAYSDTSGADWSDYGIINESSPLAPVHPQNLANWEHEVSSICYDSGAPESERWKIVWHRYLCLDANRLFEHGWIGMKTAGSPDGLWSGERKLFVGSLYDHASDDPIIGPPEVILDELHSDLNGCLAFSEPALLATDTALYLCMLGGEGNSKNGRIILLKYPHPAGPWKYKGTFILNSVDGPTLGYDGFTAPSLYKRNGKYYLIITPQIEDKYLGTFIIEIADLDNAVLKRENGVIVVEKSIFGRTDSHNGAACYIPESYASGVIYSDVMVVAPLDFRIYASFINP